MSKSENVYMIWLTEGRRGEEAAEAFGGPTPEIAIVTWCEEHSPEQDDLVTAAEAVEDPHKKGRWRKKAGGKSWTTQVSYEEKRDYACAGLSEDDPEDYK